MDNLAKPLDDSLVKAVSTAIINSSGEILLIKRNDLGIWALPGGTRELGESCEQTAIRETLEETGYSITISKRGYCYHRPNWKGGEYMLVFSGTIAGGEPIINNEASAIKFFKINRLPRLMSSHTKQIINEAIDGGGGAIHLQNISKKSILFDAIRSLDLKLIIRVIKFIRRK